MNALGLSTQFSVEVSILIDVMRLVVGILAVWLFSALRPRYGAGAKTALIAGLALYVLDGLLPNISLYSMGIFPANLFAADSLTSLVIYVVAAQAGAWVYKEQE